MTIHPGDVIPYLEMCREEGVSLQTLRAPVENWVDLYHRNGTLAVANSRRPTREVL